MAIKKARIFSDIDFDFLPHPVTGDIVRKYDETAIKKSIINLILTKPYERPFQPKLGSQVYGLLFEPVSHSTLTAMEETVKQAIDNYEPRADVISVTIEDNIVYNGVTILIWFHVFNSPQPIDLTIFLERVR